MKKAVISIILTALLVLLHVGITDRALDTIPDSMLVRASVPFDAEGIAPFSRNVTQTQYGKLSVVQTNGEYGKLAGLKMKYGEFLYEKGQAVISESLAAKIFLTDLVVGAKITVGQSEYTICGIYYNDKTLLGKLSSDIYDEIYISSDSGGYAQSFFIDMSENESAADKVMHIENEYGIRVTDYENYYEAKILIKQGQKSMILMLVLLIVVYAARYLFAGIDMSSIKDKRNILRLAAALCWIIIGAIAVKLCSFELVIPLSYLTRNSTSADYIIGCVQTVNTYSDDFIVKYTHNARLILFSLRLAIFVLGLNMCLCGWKRKGSSEQ